jgi:hypothetical protein
MENEESDSIQLCLDERQLKVLEAGMAVITFEAIKKLVKENNKSTLFSDEFIICLAWKESGFDPDSKNSKSSATGLMQLTKGAVDETNRRRPKETQYDHAEMTDAAKNIQCGSLYLDIAKSKLAGIDISYGTGTGYSKKIVECEVCLKADAEHYAIALLKIHK